MVQDQRHHHLWTEALDAPSSSPSRYRRGRETAPLLVSGRGPSPLKVPLCANILTRFVAHTGGGFPHRRLPELFSAVGCARVPEGGTGGIRSAVSGILEAADEGNRSFESCKSQIRLQILMAEGNLHYRRS